VPQRGLPEVSEEPDEVSEELAEVSEELAEEAELDKANRVDYEAEVFIIAVMWTSGGNRITTIIIAPRSVAIRAVTSLTGGTGSVAIFVRGKRHPCTPTTSPPRKRIRREEEEEEEEEAAARQTGIRGLFSRKTSLT
jgi:hypothetical protein